MAILEVTHLAAAAHPIALLAELVGRAPVGMEGGRGVGQGHKGDELGGSWRRSHRRHRRTGRQRRRGNDPHPAVASARVVDGHPRKAAADLVVEGTEHSNPDIAPEVDEGPAEQGGLSHATLARGGPMVGPLGHQQWRAAQTSSVASAKSFRPKSPPAR